MVRSCCPSNLRERVHFAMVPVSDQFHGNEISSTTSFQYVPMYMYMCFTVYNMYDIMI